MEVKTAAGHANDHDDETPPQTPMRTKTDKSGPAKPVLKSKRGAVGGVGGRDQLTALDACPRGPHDFTWPFVVPITAVFLLSVALCLAVVVRAKGTKFQNISDGTTSPTVSAVFGLFVSTGLAFAFLSVQLVRDRWEGCLSLAVSVVGSIGVAACLLLVFSQHRGAFVIRTLSSGLGFFCVAAWVAGVGAVSLSHSGVLGISRFIVGAVCLVCAGLSLGGSFAMEPYEAIMDVDCDGSCSAWRIATEVSQWTMAVASLVGLASTVLDLWGARLHVSLTTSQSL